MTDMVERIMGIVGEENPEAYSRQIAIRILEAVREPTDAMIENGNTMLRPAPVDDWGMDAADVWRAMIDEASGERAKD